MNGFCSELAFGKFDSFDTPTPRDLRRELEVFAGSEHSLVIDYFRSAFDLDSSWFPRIDGFHVINHDGYFLVSFLDIPVLLRAMEDLLAMTPNVELFSVELERYRDNIWAAIS
jgi:hypothetical protein